MRHATCIEAIKHMRATDASRANVHRDVGACRCEHTPTPCDWVGNDMHFACLHDRTHKSPQRVHTHHNGTKASRIHSPRKD